MNEIPLSANACVSCKHGKRKCDRKRPSCGTCARFARACIYEQDPSPQLHASSYRDSEQHGISRAEGGSSASDVPMQDSPDLAAASRLYEVDPYRFEILRRPTVDTTVRAELLRILSTSSAVSDTCQAYFSTIYHRLPILSQKRFYDRLPTIFDGTSSAGFSTLCLSIHLVQQQPSAVQGENMQMALYVKVKSILSLLEATGVVSFELVQCRLLVTFYEMGHALYPAASISIAACARIARVLCLHKRSPRPAGGVSDDISWEERNRVWWAVICLDRFINLCNGDSVFAAEDPKSQDPLPIEDVVWAQNVIPTSIHLNLSTPCETTVGQFARECQVSHLVGRVVRHVFDPTSDHNFHAEEALQLERTLMAFMPLLIDEEIEFGRYCAALGMCSSALFTLHESQKTTTETSDDQHRFYQSLETIATRISEFSRRLFGDAEDIETHTFSPYVPYSLYQAGVVQFHLWKHSNSASNKNALDSLKKILGHFSRRWTVAGTYVEALNTDSPPIMLPPHGFLISVGKVQ